MSYFLFSFESSPCTKLYTCRSNNLKEPQLSTNFCIQFSIWFSTVVCVYYNPKTPYSISRYMAVYWSLDALEFRIGFEPVPSLLSAVVIGLAPNDTKAQKTKQQHKHTFFGSMFASHSLLWFTSFLKKNHSKRLKIIVVLIVIRVRVIIGIAVIIVIIVITKRL